MGYTLKVTFSVPTNFTVFDCRIGATDYQPITISIDKNSPPAQVVLEDLEGAKHQVSGIVLSETGDSVPGARVTVLQTRRTVSTTPQGGQSSSAADRASPEARTDAIGRFSVPLLLPDVTEVRVLKEGFKEQRIVFEANQSAGFLEIRLERGDTGIFGIVTNAEGKPVSRFVVILYAPVSTTSRSYSRDIENEEGRFWITDVPAGTYDVLIQAPTANSVQNTKIKGIELKSGFLYGEIDAQLTELLVGKK